MIVAASTAAVPVPVADVSLTEEAAQDWMDAALMSPGMTTRPPWKFYAGPSKP